MIRLEEVDCESRVALPASEGVSATLRLDFRRDELNGRTVLAESVQQPPLRVVRAFPLEDGSVLAHLHNVSGGLLGGDQLRHSIRVGPGARVQVTTTGATRLYRPRPETAPTSQENEFNVEKGGLLEYVPDALIPYAGVRFAQRTLIQLGEGAGLFWWEVVTPGREARGEIFQYQCLNLRTDIVALGRHVAAESVHVDPRSRAVSSPARLGPYRFFATFYVCQVGLAPELWLDIEQQLRELAGQLTRPGDALWGVSALVADGVAVRCLAVHGCDVLPGLYALWRAAKRTLYDCEPIPPRKVQ